MRLSDAGVVKIRTEYAQGTTQQALAARFNVTQAYISYLVRGLRRNGTAVKLLESRTNATQEDSSAGS